MAGYSAEATVRLLARAALDKKAESLVVLDLQGLSTVADYFLVCSARSAAQIDTIVESVQAALRHEGLRLRHREGTAASGWLLLDCGDVVVHVFLDETRTFYALERLWGDAPVLSVEG
jgi:ribosome-associated protein